MVKMCDIKFWMKVVKYSGSMKALLSRGKKKIPPSMLPKIKGKEEKTKRYNGNQTRKGEGLNEMKLGKSWLM